MHAQRSSLSSLAGGAAKETGEEGLGPGDRALGLALRGFAACASGAQPRKVPEVIPDQGDL